MKAYTEEIERLRRDLIATREKNGVFMDKENFDDLHSKVESQGQELSEKIQQVRSLQENLDGKEEELEVVKAQWEESKEELIIANQVLAETRAKVENLQHNLDRKEKELELVKAQWKETKEDLIVANQDLVESRTKVEKLQHLLLNTELERDQKQHLVESHVETEKALTNQASILLRTTEETTSDLDKLYKKLDRKKHVEEANLESGRRFREDLKDQFNTLCSKLDDFRVDYASFCGEQRKKFDQFLQIQETQFATMTNVATNYLTDMKDFVDKSHTYVADQPTGMTPQKKFKYDYPRELSATSPHERIISRFTSKREQEEKNEIF